ncbi:uncharacterized protein [Ptychodera flava]|uniref:uncharacterized protein n=1 Tax=Ptychodera flava TaxID=63121 RepID=UPI00396A5031
MQCLRSTQMTHKFNSSRKSGRSFDINKKTILGMRSIGRGRRACVKFCSYTGLPLPVSNSPWLEKTSSLAETSSQVVADRLQRAVHDVRKLKMDSGEIASLEETMNIGVSVDGAWISRGFNSLYGFVSVISIDTGKVLDKHFLSSKCRECDKWEGKAKDREYVAWFIEHEPNCQINHEGSAKSMEEAGARVLFERSLQKYNVRYTQYIGDGDSSAYAAVKYTYQNENITVEKQDCVGHIQKRMGTHLRKLVEEHKGKKLEDGRALTGRNRLTNHLINAFQVFYGIALRSNKGNVEEMSKQTQAILHHYASTQDEPRHDNCPTGEESWCKWQQDKATGKKTYRPLKNPLPAAVLNAVQPVIDRLSNPALLEGAKMCYTQNANESLHHVLWSVLPKEQNHGLMEINLGSNLAVAHFNSGVEQFNKALFEATGLEVNPVSQSLWLSLDRIRSREAKLKATREYKARRKELKRKRLQKLDRFEYAEGETYASGEFDRASAKKAKRRCKTCLQPMKGHSRNTCTN